VSDTLGSDGTALAEPLAGTRSEAMSRAEREARFSKLLEEHGGALRRLASSYERDPARREDLVQEIALAIWQALPGFREECSERTFLFRIAHNRGLTHVWRRRATRGQADLTEAAPVADSREGPESRAEGNERRARLREAVLALPIGARQVITLTLEGLSQREIGEVLGISENNVAVRVSRARRLLQQALLERSDR
jgi:RNA polymerase sigma-70 factor (ECF subfamily)